MYSCGDNKNENSFLVGERETCTNFHWVPKMKKLPFLSNSIVISQGAVFSACGHVHNGYFHIYFSEQFCWGYNTEVSLHL